MFAYLYMNDHALWHPQIASLLRPLRVTFYSHIHSQSIVISTH